ncbi:MAG: YhgE/Pip domain-containing protein [Clostridium sp.]
MKEALKVYIRDLKNIKNNKVMIIIFIFLSILPSVYAWFNIKAAWDPYNNLSDISVAVVNLDRGARVLDKDINIGNSAVDELKKKDSLKFVFVNPKEASKGVEKGDYYASIVIPENFSNDIATAVHEDPIRPKIIYTVNEKINAIAPKITGKSASALQEEIGKDFIKVVSKSIFKELNKLDEKLDEKKPIISRIEDTVNEAGDKIDDMKVVVNGFYEAGSSSKELVKVIKEQIPGITQSIDDSIKISNLAMEFVENSIGNIEEAAPFIWEQLVFISKTSQNINNIIEPSDVTTSGKVLIDKVQFIRKTQQLMLSRVNNIIVLLESIGIDKYPLLNNFYSKMLDVRGKLNKSIEVLYGVERDLEKGIDIGEDSIVKLKKGLDSVSVATKDVADNFNGRYKDSFDDISDGIQEGLTDISKVLGDFRDDASRVLDKGVNMLSQAKDKIEDADKYYNKYKDKLKDLKDNEKVKKLLELLEADAVSESDFLSSPVDLVTQKVYGLPNYGSAMTPFYTTLSLWVGALLMVSLLTPIVYCKEGEFKPGSKFLGRLLVFISIGIIQALIVTLGDIFILGSYVQHKFLFVLAGIFASIVFVGIVYTLTFLMGNVGKAAGVLLLVLQLSASGGTFPIEVTPKFFKVINPYMPFTYSINLMRETVAGILPEAAINDALRLSMFFIIILMGWFASKHKSANVHDFMSKKMKESGLVLK